MSDTKILKFPHCVLRNNFSAKAQKNVCLFIREIQDFPHFIRNRNWFCTAFWTLNFRVGFYSDLTIKSCTFTVSIIRVSKYSFRRVRWKKKIYYKDKVFASSKWPGTTFLLGYFYQLWHFPMVNLSVSFFDHNYFRILYI